MATNEYQPGLGLSNLQASLQQYIQAEEDRAQRKADSQELMVSSAQAGKSVYDYWAMDQMSKQKDLLSQTIDTEFINPLTNRPIAEKTFQASQEYTNKSTFGKLGWDKGPTFEKGRMFTPANQRVSMTDANPMNPSEFKEFQKGSIDKSMDYIKGKYSSGVDSIERSVSNYRIDKAIDQGMSGDLPIGFRDSIFESQYSIEPVAPIRPSIGVDSGYGDSLSQPAAIDMIDSPGFQEFKNFESPAPFSKYQQGMQDFDTIRGGGTTSSINITDNELMDIAMSGLESPAVEGGTMTASAGMSDSYTAAGDILGSADEAVAATGEASKFSKFAGGAGKALGIAGTAYGAYNLANNWDDMSGSERAQGMMQTIGGGMMATGVGAPVGLALSAAGTIWDWLD